jgi:heme-degrading monooxygenase HmoA
MLLERSELLIREGQEEAFATAMRERGIPLLQRVSGVISVHMGRGVENPDKFLLLVRWESLGAHTLFAETPALQDLMAIMTPHTKSGGMEHFNMS